MTTRKLQYKAIKGTASTHVGSPGDIFYDPAVAELRMYDGNPGGMTVGTDLTTVTSHILPSADLTYDLGSTSSQWRSLYVGTSTIYLGGTPVSVSGGTLTVDGNPVSSNTVASVMVNNGGSYTLTGTTGTMITVAVALAGEGDITIDAEIPAGGQAATVNGKYIDTNLGSVANLGATFPITLSSGYLHQLTFVNMGDANSIYGPQWVWQTTGMATISS